VARPARLLLAIALGLLPAAALDLLLTPRLARAQAPQQQLQDVQKQLQESRNRQRELDREAQQLARREQELQRRLVQAARKLQVQEDAVSRSEEQLGQLITEEAAAAEALAARREDLAATLGSLARLARQPPDAMVLAPGSALDMVRASQLLADLVPEIETRAARLRGELERLAGLRRSIAQQQERLGAAITRLDAERRELELLQAETTAQAAQTREDRQAERERATRLAEQAKDLRALVDRLLEQERREAEARQKREAERRNPRQPPDNYAALEGTAALPARGRILTRFGETDANGLPSRGLSIETRPGGQVIAPADGKVMFAGLFRGYGQLLIIAHGGGYHSLLAGFGRIDRAVGQFVLAGEPVGLMAPEATAKPTLYLELRRKGEPVNPLPWLAAGDRKVSG